MSTHSATETRDSQPQYSIRTAVAGYGLSGSVFHAPLIAANPAFSLDLISTSDAGRRSDAEGRYPEAQVVETPEDILALAGELDLLVIGTPPATHYPLAKAALEAGLDVVVDKPFTVRSAQGQELIELAARLGRVLTVYQNRRWDNGFLTIRKLIESGELGDVTRFESAMERWSPSISKSWKAAATVEDGGGIFLDLGTHLLDMAVQLFGPAEVLHAELAARRADERADDDIFVVLKHASRDGKPAVISHLTMNMLCAQPGPARPSECWGPRPHTPNTGRTRRKPSFRAAPCPLTRATASNPPKRTANWELRGHSAPSPASPERTKSFTGFSRIKSTTAAPARRCRCPLIRLALLRCFG